MLRDQRRSFNQDARSILSNLLPPLKIFGKEYIPSDGPCLVTVNHFARFGFQSWWLALAVGSVVPNEIHWIITSGWTFPDSLRSGLVTPLTRWVFTRIARVYGFTNMPPMPPRPEEFEDRVRAVRQVLAHAGQASSPWIGLAPEGKDAPMGILQQPPPGSGRFMLQLASLGLMILPAGIFETNGRLCVRFGKSYRLKVPQEIKSKERDIFASEIVMRQIALQLPPELHGFYAQPVTAPFVSTGVYDSNHQIEASRNETSDNQGNFLP